MKDHDIISATPYPLQTQVPVSSTPEKNENKAKSMKIPAVKLPSLPQKSKAVLGKIISLNFFALV